MLYLTCFGVTRWWLVGALFAGPLLLVLLFACLLACFGLVALRCFAVVCRLCRFGCMGYLFILWFGLNLVLFVNLVAFVVVCGYLWFAFGVVVFLFLLCVRLLWLAFVGCLLSVCYMFTFV